MKSRKKIVMLMIGFGLVLFSCKKDNGNSDEEALKIGQSYAGGIIFYLDGTGKHGLVTLPEDQSASAKWSVGTLSRINASGLGVGMGQLNTSTIISAQSTGDYAASICDKLTMNGYSDWFLPSKSELLLLYQQRDAIGGFSTGYYWSSSEYDTLHAWDLYFPYGPQYFMKKDSGGRVRAVRAF
jgi:hypothetical protein